MIDALVEYDGKRYNVIFDPFPLVEIHELTDEGIVVVKDPELIQTLLLILEERHEPNNTGNNVKG